MSSGLWHLKIKDTTYMYNIEIVEESSFEWSWGIA